MKGNIENGKYVGKIVSISARVYLNFELEDGRKVSEWYDLASEKGPAFLKKELAKIGLQGNNLKEIVGRAAQLKSLPVEFSVVNKDTGYCSIYLEGLAKGTAAATAGAEDELPFDFYD